MEARLRRGNLSAEIGGFVGRSRELTAVTSLIRQYRLVTLTGVAGVGKSRLARRAADRLGRDLPEGVWVAELSGERNPDLLAHHVADALGMVEQSVRPQAEVLADYLADKHLLLLLDTCEHLITACHDLVGRLLGLAPGLRVLATSRQPLGLPYERVYTVEPMPVPEPGASAPGDYGAVRLFLERARALAPDRNPDVDAVARLCRRLDGIPLAIELAAGLTRTLSADQIADALEDRFALLAGAGRTPVARHRTLRTAVGWSHELLAAEERLLWARLTVFAGAFDIPAAQAVCADERLPDVRGPLARLVDKSVVIADGPRHRMLAMMREYGAEWLRRLGEEERLARRHREHYLFLAQRADEEWDGAAQAEWADWAHTEMPNLRLALDGGIGDPVGLELAGTLWFAWFCIGHVREGRYYLDRALHAHRRPGPARTKALWAAGLVALAQGDLAAMEHRAEEALAEARHYGDTVATGYATYTLGILHLLRGDLGRADTLTAEAVAHFRRVPRPGVGLPIAEFARALLHTVRGDHQRALDALEPHRSGCADRGEQWARSYGEIVCSHARLARGETAEAAAHARGALGAKWRLGDAMGCAMAIDRLAAVAAARHYPERAAYLLGVAQRMWARMGRPRLGSPGLTASRDRVEADARRVLGDAAYTAAYTLGLTVDPREALERVRDL